MRVGRLDGCSICWALYELGSINWVAHTAERKPKHPVCESLARQVSGTQERREKKNVQVLLLRHFIGALGFYVIREQLDIEKVLFKESSLCRCVCQGNEKGGG